MSQPNPLWDLIQGYLDDSSHRYSPKVADLSRETGVSDQVFSKWKAKPVLPTTPQLIRVSQATGISYPELLIAALKGKGFLPLEVEDVEDAIAGLADRRTISEWMDAVLRAQTEVYEALDMIAEREVLISDLLDGGLGASELDPRDPNDRAAAHLRAVATLRERVGTFTHAKIGSKGGEADGDATATSEPGSRPGKKSDYVKAAREGEPALRKRRREHDKASEAIPDDPTGMEPI